MQNILEHLKGQPKFVNCDFSKDSHKESYKNLLEIISDESKIRHAIPLEFGYIKELGNLTSATLASFLFFKIKERIPSNKKLKYPNGWIPVHANDLGKRIGVSCPKCNTLVEFSNKFCSNCGVNKEDHFKKLQSELLADQQRRLQALQTELQNGQTDYTSIIRAHPELNKTLGTGCISGLFGIGTIMLSAVVGLSTESWAAFFLVLIVLVGGFALLSSSRVISRRKKSVSEYINGQLIPQIASTKGEINKIQNEKYGDESTIIQDDYDQPWLQ
jgi:hypothetical protein